MPGTAPGPQQSLGLPGSQEGQPEASQPGITGGAVRGSPVGRSVGGGGTKIRPPASGGGGSPGKWHRH